MEGGGFGVHLTGRSPANERGTRREKKQMERDLVQWPNGREEGSEFSGNSSQSRGNGSFRLVECVALFLL